MRGKSKVRSIALALAAAAAAAGVSQTLGCDAARSAREFAARKVYVAPGERDAYYGFLSGGRSGSAFVVGIPSCRLIREIPIFEPRAAYGYAMHEGDVRRQELAATGGLWGDAHHPALSETHGIADGRYLWISDLANGRLARVRLDTFEADRIVKIPNLQGASGIAAVSPDTKYIVVNGAFELPTDGLVGNIAPYTSVVAFVDPESMETKFEVRIPGNVDIADTSKDGRYVFSSVYNLERGKDVDAMTVFDRDAVAAIDIPAVEKSIAAGKGRPFNGVSILDPEENPGVLTLIPVPKNPHGVTVTPDGKYVVASGKLSPTVTIIDAATLKIIAEPVVGSGPWSTTFDNRGNAYTSLYLDSQVVKWNIAKAVKGAPDYVVDRIAVHYNVGQVKAVGGGSRHPAGDYLLAFNTLSKDQYLPVGPEVPPGQELIDISGEKMKLLASFPVPPEPDDAEFLDAAVLVPKVKPVDGRGGDGVVAGEESVVRTGPHSVTVQMTMIRSAYTPDHVEVREGDRVTFRMTNVETMRGMAHGFALPDHDLNVSLAPGVTRTITVDAGRPGVYWYYCTNFCSVLHLEMRGRMIVHPKDSTATLADWHAPGKTRAAGPIAGTPLSGGPP